jgi:chromosome partitioning protein
MDTILILSAKGGAGKTTLTRELAVAATLEGRTVAMIDLDPQAGLAGWYSRREAETPLLMRLPRGGDLGELAKEGIEELLIDLPPGRPSAAARLIAQADVALVPVRATPDDLTALGATLDVLRGHPRWAFIINQIPPRSRLADSALRELAALGRVAPATLGTRQDYPAAAIAGRAAVETSGTRSHDEVIQLRAYVNALLKESRHGKGRGKSKS